jgi:cysteine synthase
MRVNNISELIGGTPIVRLNRQCRQGMAEVYVKLEFQNPGGSVKDRIALSMIQALEKEEKINGDTVLVEPTSGNTGNRFSDGGRSQRVPAYPDHAGYHDG